MTQEIQFGETFDGQLLANAPKVRLSRRGIIMGLAAGSVFPFVSGCATNAATGESQATTTTARRTRRAVITRISCAVPPARCRGARAG